MYRSRSYRLSQRRRIIKWKKNFIKATDHWNYNGEDGRLAKGKIHCLCHMCRCRYEEINIRKEKLLKIDMKEQIAETC